MKLYEPAANMSVYDYESVNTAILVPKQSKTVKLDLYLMT